MSQFVQDYKFQFPRKKSMYVVIYINVTLKKKSMLPFRSEHAQPRPRSGKGTGTIFISAEQFTPFLTKIPGHFRVHKIPTPNYTHPSGNL